MAHLKQSHPGTMRFLVTDCCRTVVHSHEESTMLRLTQTSHALLPSCPNSMTAYGTAAGENSYSILGNDNGVFTEKLLEALRSPRSFNLEHRSLFSQVRAAVNHVVLFHPAFVDARLHGANIEQMPENVDSTIGDFVFCPHPALVQKYDELHDVNAVQSYFAAHPDEIIHSNN